MDKTQRNRQKIERNKDTTLMVKLSLISQLTLAGGLGPCPIDNKGIAKF
jgi:hypothetical protein